MGVWVAPGSAVDLVDKISILEPSVKIEADEWDSGDFKSADSTEERPVRQSGKCETAVKARKYWNTVFIYSIKAVLKHAVTKR
jgi:hypothetical protein